MKAKLMIKHIVVKEKNLDFMKYSLVDEHGKLIDCRMKKSIAREMIDKINECGKCEIECDEIKINYGYEFPRVYISEITDVKKIY